MPKIIDRDKYRCELAERAAGFFSKHGYAGVGMRGIADHLGMSKSALYHYFPTKEALFLASTKVVMSRTAGAPIDTMGSQEAQLAALMDVLRANFGSELTLVFDYLRGKTPEEIASDEAMQISLSTYLNIMERIVGPERASQTLSAVMGELMLDYLSGGVLSD
ncbi:TetR/AcrR family transcriptional regulator [Yoonia sp. I 8.24]|uniref:TetR/AcrR family transcriptional regulator n=1 Tax=Yoonia sp. I 8.24 TaxID=1537229 RepID=UPI001EDD725E|nr:TetR/AcrR family transcriptional regulator [Yoonia sp. I 8.24]MCG3268609.1 TetR/AcrR family transcriptional regulator [Yoonia sp. I 8.24]